MNTTPVLTADVIAVALVTAYRFGERDPSELLGAAPSVTILADAAIVIKDRFRLRTNEAARMCCLVRPSRAVAVKMGDSFACAKRDRRQKAIKAALEVVAPKAKTEVLCVGRQFGKTEAARTQGLAEEDRARLARRLAWVPKPKVVEAPPPPPSLRDHGSSASKPAAKAVEEKRPVPIITMKNGKLLPIPALLPKEQMTPEYVAKRNAIAIAHIRAHRAHLAAKAERS
jgi:hypothetical protein